MWVAGAMTMYATGLLESELGVGIKPRVGVSRFVGLNSDKVSHSQPNSLLEPVYLQEQEGGLPSLSRTDMGQRDGPQCGTGIRFDSRAWSDSEGKVL
ncbi:hypothetical protein OK016_28060 [Vibrio chagasii]|nr:hypothetical protein [Vibrio chagasii]